MMAGGGPFKCAPGQVTDDGELTMSLAWVRLTASYLSLASLCHDRRTPRPHRPAHMISAPQRATKPRRRVTRAWHSWASEMPTQFRGATRCSIVR